MKMETGKHFAIHENPWVVNEDVFTSSSKLSDLKSKPTK